MSFYQDHKRQIGLTLLIGGVIPWAILMAYIVYIRTPSWPLMAVTIGCWAVFFIGKSMLKTGSEESARVELEE